MKIVQKDSIITIYLIFSKIMWTFDIIFNGQAKPKIMEFYNFIVLQTTITFQKKCPLEMFYLSTVACLAGELNHCSTLTCFSYILNLIN